MLIFQTLLVQFRVAEIELGLNMDVPVSLLNVFGFSLFVHIIVHNPITYISTKK